MNHEIPDCQAGFRNGRGTRDQIANICWIIKKARELHKNIYFCFIDYTKAFDCVDHNKLWKILKRWEYQTTLPAFWEICMQVKKQQLEMTWNTSLVPNWEYVKAVCCHPPYLIIYRVHHTKCCSGWSTAGIKIAIRNINNLRYADNTTLMAESKEELKSLLMKVKEESEKVSWKLNTQKTKIMAYSSIISWQMNGETMETVRDFIYYYLCVCVSKITADGDCSHEIKRHLLLEEKLWPTYTAY